MKTLSATDQDLDFSIADDIESVLQRVRQRLQFWSGDWFLNQTEGVPYLPSVLGRNFNAALAEQAVTNQVLSVPGVTEIISIAITFSNNTRTLFFNLRIKTDAGIGVITAER